MAKYELIMQPSIEKDTFLFFKRFPVAQMYYLLALTKGGYLNGYIH